MHAPSATNSAFFPGKLSQQTVVCVVFFYIAAFVVSTRTTERPIKDPMHAFAGVFYSFVCTIGNAVLECPFIPLSLLQLQARRITDSWKLAFTKLMLARSLIHRSDSIPRRKLNLAPCYYH